MAAAGRGVRPYQSRSPSWSFLARCLLRVFPDLSKRGWLCGFSRAPSGPLACVIIAVVVPVAVLEGIVWGGDE